MGYYPVSLFVGNQSVFSTLGDHADHSGFSGEVLTPTTLTAELPPTWAAVILLTRAGPGLATGYMHNLRAQTRRDGSMANYDSSTSTAVHGWDSYAFVGGPGAG